MYYLKTRAGLFYKARTSSFLNGLKHAPSYEYIYKKKNSKSMLYKPRKSRLKF